MTNPELTPIPAMITCPKCGFQQPSDQYCAQCGVDLHKLQKNPASLISNALKKPAVLIVIAVAALALTIQGVRTLRSKPKPDIVSQDLEPRERVANKSRSASERGDSSNSQTVSADAGTSSASRATNLDSHQATAFAPESPQTPDQGGGTAESATTTAPGAKTATATPASADGNGKTAASTAAEAAELQVTFAWAEVSREWLQLMGAASPGFHRVVELDTKLRESVGGYRILEVTRQKLADKATTTTLTHGERLSIRFESTSASATGLSGSIQPAMRGADGSIRSPAAAAVSIDKGQGSIVTLGAGTTPSAAAGAPPANGAEIVLLILPRWGTSRNP